jgi:hypothetical protein
LTADLFHNGVLRANDLSDNFDAATNVKSQAPVKSNQSVVERIRNDDTDFPEFKA